MSELGSEDPAEIGDILAGPPTGPAGRTLEYLEVIDKRGGRGKRMDILRIAGSEAAANRWISFFIEKNILIESREIDGSKTYHKTEFGEIFHNTLRHHKIVKIITEHLSGRRLKL